MTCKLTYKCDYCDKDLGNGLQSRTGSLYGTDVDFLKTTPSDSTWHVCSDICLVDLFESWIAKVKEKMARKLEDERGTRKHGGFE